MLIEQIQELRAQILQIAHSYGASNVRVFGSVAKGEESTSSDVDFLVTLPRGYDMFTQRLPLCEALAELLNRDIDMS